MPGPTTIGCGLAQGFDFVIGGEGNDTLDGGEGNDALWGGFAALGPSVFFGANFPAEAYDPIQDPNQFPAGAFELAPLYAAYEAQYPTATQTLPAYVPPAIMPAGLLGQSFSGTAGDGNDLLYGRGGTDWLLGGDGTDRLEGGNGADYLDGGAGNDNANAFAGADFGQGQESHRGGLYGGAGEDIIRGGDNNDDLHGDAGIDQLYGENGSDKLWGDAGDDQGEQRGQRLYGGNDGDYLYAYAASSVALVESASVGDQLFGGSGVDLVYGNLRQEVLAGDAGSDIIYGEGVVGPNYDGSEVLTEPFDPPLKVPYDPIQPVEPNDPHWTDPLVDRRHIEGGNDKLYGGSGSDKLYGGGGDDELWGGADGDYLEGQNGQDTLYGGTWTDMLVLDTNKYYNYPDQFQEIFDGHWDNEPNDGKIDADDNATDTLLIEGTVNQDVNDQILLAEDSTGRLLVGLADSVTRPNPASPLADQRVIAAALARLEWASADRAVPDQRLRRPRHGLVLEQ